MKYKVGDKVRVRTDHPNGRCGINCFTLIECMQAIRGKVVTIQYAYPAGYYCIAEGGVYAIWSECMLEPVETKQVKFIKKESKTMNIKAFAKKILDKDTKTLIKADFLDDDLELTDEGSEALMAELFTDYKAKLLTVAEEVIKEKKKDKDCK